MEPAIRRVLRYEVPVDDEWHTIALADLSRPVHVGVARNPSVVEFWMIQYGPPTIDQRFRVFATGQPVEGYYCGTAIVLTGGMPLVWHLFEKE
jgi:hypothetical protein